MPGGPVLMCGGPSTFEGGSEGRIRYLTLVLLLLCFYDVVLSIVGGGAHLFLVV